MKITIESTSKIVILVVDGIDVPARIWQGETNDGVPVQAFITRISPEVDRDDPQLERMTAEFEKDLKRVVQPQPTVAAIPLRMII